MRKKFSLSFKKTKSQKIKVPNFLLFKLKMWPATEYILSTAADEAGILKYLRAKEAK